MILILTDKNDVHANHVIKGIANRFLPYQRLNVDVESLRNTKVFYQNNVWSIIQDDKTISIDEVICVWNRRTFVELLLDEQFDQTSEFKIWKNEWNKTLLGIYSSLRDKPWLNAWREAYKAENKYLQMETALNIGFKIPSTIVSNDKIKLTDFVESHQKVVLKLMHQDFYKNQDGEYRGIYVNLIDKTQLEKFSEESENPIVLQEYIDKDYEVRYTVVGDKHYICKIDSQKSERAKIDWRRYDIPNTPHSIIEPPKEIKSMVSSFMISMGVEYGALDFVVDINGNWIFLEINSMGQFLWIEDLTGLKISEGIIDWMELKLKSVLTIN